MIDQLVQICKERDVDLQELLRAVNSRRKTIIREVNAWNAGEWTPISTWLEKKQVDTTQIPIVMKCLKNLYSC